MEVNRTARPLVLIESPFSHYQPFGVDLHRAYLELCLYDSIQRGEAPVATHKLYTVCLNDKIPEERKLGMQMLETFLTLTDYHAVYYDLGVSGGMAWGIEMAEKMGKKVHPRSLFAHPVPEVLRKNIA